MTYVFIGLSMMAFLSASMLAIDVGMLMTARNQAQNSADAGALAGATALVYDNYNDRTADRPGSDQRDRAPRIANKVMAGQVSVNPADVEFLNDPSGAAESRQGDGAPHGGARQRGVDADRPVLRDHAPPTSARPRPPKRRRPTR